MTWYLIKHRDNNDLMVHDPQCLGHALATVTVSKPV